MEKDKKEEEEILLCKNESCGQPISDSEHLRNNGFCNKCLHELYLEYGAGNDE